ncbi:MAG: PAS domain S-box protein [Chloroflexi bacterium]|nr:PAS domain S-box protein [Chloroflexota bacterium]
MVGTMNPMAVNPRLLKRLQDRAEQENVSVETLLERWLDSDAVRAQADLLQQVSDAIITTDRDLLITTWNSAAERIYGWTEAEALGRKIDDLLKTEWMVESEAQAQKTLEETGLWRGEVKQWAKDGQARYIWAAVSWLKDAQGAITGGITVNRDITGDKRAEAALQEGEAILRALIEQSLDSIRILDDRQRIVVWNAASEELTGLKREDVLGKPFFEVTKPLFPDDLKSPETYRWYQERLDQVSQAVQDGEVILSEYQIQRPDGTIRLVETRVFPVLAGGRVYVCGINRDITEKKQAERSLEESRRQLATLLDNLPGMAYRCLNNSEWTMVFVSSGCTALTGYAPADLLDNRRISYDAIIHPDDREFVWREVEAALDARRSFEIEYRIIAADQTEKYVWERGSGIFEKGQVAFIEGFISDITERKRAEAALRASEARLRSLIETQTTYVVRTDMNGDYTYVNEAFFRRFCWKHERVDDLIGTFSLLSIAPEDHEKTREAVNACIQNPGAPVQVVLRKPTQDDGVFWTLWEFVALQNGGGAVTEIQCMGIDITELMQARQQLQLQEQALRFAANAIVITDQDGLIRWANPAFTTLTGYTFEEAQGLKTNLLKSGVQDAAFYEVLWSTILSGQVWQGRLVNRRKDGSLYIEEQTITPVRDGSGAITHFVAIKQDITEREQAEQMRLEQERLKLNLRKEQELNVLVQKAVSTLFHDIRTPLAAIGTAKDMLNLYFDRINEEQRREKLESIDRQLRYVLELLDDMMMVVTGSLNYDVFKPAPVNLPALCQASIGEIRMAAGSGHRFRFVTDGRIRTAKVDEMLVSRILLNLLSNAVKFSPEASEIRLELSRQDDWIVLRVIDQGIGIAEADQPHIFEPFYRAESARGVGGTGLGLNIVRDCVTRHQGQVSVESRLGAGATFTVRLPLLD